MGHLIFNIAFSWYLSALWGQYDQVGLLLAMAAFVLVGKKAEILAPTLLTAAILIKPTSLILLPFFGYWYLRKGNKFDLLKITGMVLPLIFFWITTSPYTYKNPFIFARYDLTRIIFEKSAPRVSVNAFNFWRIFIGDTAQNPNMLFLFIPTSVWSIAAFLGLNLLAVYRSEIDKDSQSRLWEYLFVISAGSWLFMTGMLERYLFAGIVFGLVAVVNHPKLVKLWLVMSLIFWLNLFYHWWLPSTLSSLKNLLLFDNSLFTRLLAVLNTGLYITIAISLMRLSKPKPGSFQKSLFHQVAKLKVAGGIWLPKVNKQK